MLLLVVPFALAAHFAHAQPLVTFVAAAAAIIPLAGVLGEATEDLAGRIGPTLGGILNATMGNATELIIAFFALRLGHVQVVKASLSGSIIGNLLLVLGLSILAGGLKREKQTFSRTATATNSTMLFIAVVALIMPAVFDLTVFGNLRQQNPFLEKLSLATSAVLIIIYLVSFIFMLKTHKAVFHHGQTEGAHAAAHGGAMRPVVSLVTATVLIGFLSEMLVSEIDMVTKSLGMTETFVGVIVVAIIGNAAEHSTAIFVARRNQMDLAMTIAIGSNTQIALRCAVAGLSFRGARESHVTGLRRTRNCIHRALCADRGNDLRRRREQLVRRYATACGIHHPGRVLLLCAFVRREQIKATAASR
ncbi:MAG TPA: calcium/proton exchanger [Clostridia bacterium]|nr:calcium/proton exchanger [Clostridia bacterium]